MKDGRYALDANKVVADSKYKQYVFHERDIQSKIMKVHNAKKFPMVGV